MKIKETHIFFLVHRICYCRVIALFNVFHFYYILRLEACEQNISRTVLARVSVLGSQIVSDLINFW